MVLSMGSFRILQGFRNFEFFCFASRVREYRNLSSGKFLRYALRSILNAYLDDGREDFMGIRNNASRRSPGRDIADFSCVTNDFQGSMDSLPSFSHFGSLGRGLGTRRIQTGFPAGLGTLWKRKCVLKGMGGVEGLRNVPSAKPQARFVTQFFSKRYWEWVFGIGMSKSVGRGRKMGI